MSIIKEFKKLSLCNKIAAVGSIASIIGLGIAIIPSTTVSQKPTDNSAQTIDFNSLDITGKWNQGSAMEIVNSALYTYKWNEGNLKNEFCSSDYCDPIHTFIGEYKLLYNDNDKELIIIVMASINRGSTCRVCIPHLSLFEFEKQPQGWKLINSDINSPPHFICDSVF